MNVPTVICLSTIFISFGSVPSSGWLVHRAILHLTFSSTTIHTGFTILTFPPGTPWVSVSPHPPQHCLFLLLWAEAILPYQAKCLQFSATSPALYYHLLQLPGTQWGPLLPFLSMYPGLGMQSAILLSLVSVMVALSPHSCRSSSLIHVWVCLTAVSAVPTPDGHRWWTSQDVLMTPVPRSGKQLQPQEVGKKNKVNICACPSGNF